MKYKLWISPEGLDFLKDWWGCGKRMKTHEIFAWKCPNEEKNSSKFNISFGRKDDMDSGFCINCSIEDAQKLAECISTALNK